MLVVSFLSSSLLCSHNVSCTSLLDYYCPIPSDIQSDVECDLGSLTQQKLKAICGRLIGAHVSHDKVCDYNQGTSCSGRYFIYVNFTSGDNTSTEELNYTK